MSWKEEKVLEKYISSSAGINGKITARSNGTNVAATDASREYNMLKVANPKGGILGGVLFSAGSAADSKILYRIYVDDVLARAFAYPANKTVSYPFFPMFYQLDGDYFLNISNYDPSYYHATNATYIKSIRNDISVNFLFGSQVSSESYIYVTKLPITFSKSLRITAQNYTTTSGVTVYPTIHYEYFLYE